MKLKYILNSLGLTGLILLNSQLAAQESGDVLESQLTEAAVEVFDLAESLYPTLFSQRTEFRQTQGYIYRFYAEAGVYIGIRDGSVYLLGGPFGDSPTNQGTIAATREFLQEVQDRRQQIPDVEVPDVDISGLYDLTISGTVTTVVSGFTAPPVDFNLTLNDVPAPNPGDVDDINTEIADTLSGVAGVTSLDFMTTNNTENRVTFTVSFSAMNAGVSANYELTYDYVR